MKMIKTVVGITLILIVLSVSCCLEPEDQANHHIAYEKVTDRGVIQDTFDDGSLNPELWQLTRDGDFKESRIDVYDVDPTETPDYRLRLRANTIGTRDDTVKFLGVRSIEKVNCSNSTTISFDLDWNNQSNGCYLTAAIYLCPTVTTGNPGDENDWLKIGYVGVPPGRNARCVIATKSNGKVTYLYTEGWPEQRTGRHIACQQIKINLDNERIDISENEQPLYHSPSHSLPFTSAYLYLQMSSHSNYPAREIYFDNIVVAPDALPSSLEGN